MSHFIWWLSSGGVLGFFGGGFCMHLMEYVFITWAIYFFIYVWFGQFQSSTLECAVWIKPAKNRRQKTRKKERKKLYSIYIIYV